MTVAEPVHGQNLVVQQRPLDDPDWPTFAAGRTERLPFHDRAWVDVLTKAYGYRAFIAVATDGDGHIAAGLPVVEVRRPLGPRRWLALPFTDYCPPLAVDGAAAHTFVNGLDALRREKGAASLELRAELDAPSYGVGVRHVLELDPDPDAVFARFRKKQVQHAVKKAQREGIVSTRITRERSDLDAFLRLHVATRRRLGIPVQPPAFFDRLWERVLVRGGGFLVVAEADAKPVSAAIFLTGGSTVVYKFSASDASAWRLHPNHLVLWAAIRLACLDGYRWFDFGRTETAHEGLRVFKSGWGGDEVPLRYSLLGRDVPEEADAQGDRSLAAAVIRRSPTFVCRLAGRALYRYAA